MREREERWDNSRCWRQLEFQGPPRADGETEPPRADSRRALRRLGGEALRLTPLTPLRDVSSEKRREEELVEDDEENNLRGNEGLARDSTTLVKVDAQLYLERTQPHLTDLSTVVDGLHGFLAMRMANSLPLLLLLLGCQRTQSPIPTIQRTHTIT